MSDTLYDHYKDTCAVQRAACGERNRYFLCVLVLVFLLGIFAYDPQSGAAIAESVLAKYGFDLTLSGRMIQSLLWCAILYAYIRYLQSMTTVERTYLYLNGVELDLTKAGVSINREGANYSDNWPVLSKVIDWIYKRFFIVLFEAILVYKAIREGFSFDLLVIMDWAVLLVFTMLSILYWVYLRKINQAYEGLGSS